MTFFTHRLLLLSITLSVIFSLHIRNTRYNHLLKDQYLQNHAEQLEQTLDGSDDSDQVLNNFKAHSLSNHQKGGAKPNAPSRLLQAQPNPNTEPPKRQDNSNTEPPKKQDNSNPPNKQDPNEPPKQPSDKPSPQNKQKNPPQAVVDNLLKQLKSQKWSDHGNSNQEGQIDFNGLKVRCAFGCKVCSNSNNLTQCDTCLDGFSIDTSKTCVKCNDLCLTCSASNSANCLTCYPGWTITASTDGTTSTCAKCTDSHCGLCSTTDNCIYCKNSFSLGFDGKCGNCTSNCKICGIITCTKCYDGYLLNLQADGIQKCKLCQDGCALCKNLTDCQKCYPGFFLDTTSQTCKKCPQNCWRCSQSSSCQRCVAGSLLVDKNCTAPIEFCAILNQNGTCRECFWGYNKTEDQKSCVNSSSVNQEQVKQMGCKMREFKKTQKCLACNSTFKNCQDCSETTCFRCLRGFVLSTDRLACNACNSTLPGCQKCQNSIFCASCAKGYFMEQDSSDTGVVSYGKCIKCDLNCLTCNERSIYCTSCTSGFALSTSRSCLPLNQFNFTVLLGLDLPGFTQKIGYFKTELAKLINDANASQAQKEKFLQITKVSTGSIKVEGLMSASSSQAIESTRKNFDSTFAVGSTFAGIQVLSSTLTPIQYQTTPTPSADNSSSSKTGMIIGIVVGGVCAILIGVGIAVFVVRYLKRKAIENGQIGNDKKTGSTQDEIAATGTIQSAQKLNIEFPKLQKVNKATVQSKMICL